MDKQATEYSYYRVSPALTKQDALENYIGALKRSKPDVDFSSIEKKLSVNDVKTEWFFSVKTELIVTSASWSGDLSIDYLSKEVDYAKEDPTGDYGCSRIKWITTYRSKINRYPQYFGEYKPSTDKTYVHCPIDNYYEFVKYCQRNCCEKDDSCGDTTAIAKRLESELLPLTDSIEEWLIKYYTNRYLIKEELSIDIDIEKIQDIFLENVRCSSFAYKVYNTIIYFPIYTIDAGYGKEYVDSTLDRRMHKGDMTVYPSVSPQEALNILIAKTRADRCCSQKFRDQVANFDLNCCKKRWCVVTDGDPRFAGISPQKVNDTYDMRRERVRYMFTHNIRYYDADKTHLYQTYTFPFENRSLVVNAATKEIEKYSSEKNEEYYKEKTAIAKEQGELKEKLQRKCARMIFRNVIVYLLAVLLLGYVYYNAIKPMHETALGNFWFGAISCTAFMILEIVFFVYSVLRIRKDVLGVFLRHIDTTSYLNVYQQCKKETCVAHLLFVFIPLIIGLLFIIIGIGLNETLQLLKRIFISPFEC